MVERQRRASLKDVAAQAHTSIATASRALSGTGYVAETTRNRILDAAKALSYQPNLRARGLRQRFSRSIGLIIPNLLNAYYTALADAISQQLASHGYHLLLSSTRDEPATEKDTVTDMVGQAVDGLIWVPASSDGGLLDYLASQHTPVVIIVRRLPNDPVDTVVFEDSNGSKAATQHLISLGHQRIGYIGGDVMFSSNQLRWQGHLDALHEAGVPVDETLIKLGTNRSTWGTMATNDLLRLPSPPTAIFVASNAIMPGVIRALRQLDVACRRICRSFASMTWSGSRSRSRPLRRSTPPPPLWRSRLLICCSPASSTAMLLSGHRFSWRSTSSWSSGDRRRPLAPRRCRFGKAISRKHRFDCPHARPNTRDRGDRTNMDATLQNVYDEVINGNRAGVEAGVRKAMEAKLPAATILNQGLIAAMTEVGARFERQEFYVPEMLVAARAMQTGLAILKPQLVEGGIKAVGKVVLGTVKGDLHDIGKTLVGMMLEGAGFEIVDLGTDVPPAKFAEVARSSGANIVGLSALLTTTMQNMRATVEALEDMGIRQQVKVMIGGAPVTDAYAKEIGADGYAPDASRAVALAKQLM